MLPDGVTEESQYSHSSLPKHKPQGASASGGDSQQGALMQKDGDSMNHTLRAVLLQPRAQVIPAASRNRRTGWQCPGMAEEGRRD